MFNSVSATAQPAISGSLPALGLSALVLSLATLGKPSLPAQDGIGPDSRHAVVNGGEAARFLRAIMDALGCATQPIEDEHG